jgi:hypothetical protein
MEFLFILIGVLFLVAIPYMVAASRRKAIAALLPFGRQLVGLDGLAGISCVDAAQSIVVRRHGDAQNLVLTWDKISSCDIIEESGGQQTETVASARRSGVLGRAVVGRLLGGNAGEVVGGLTGRTNTRSRSLTEEQVSRILCQIRFADVGLPEVSIRLYTDPYGRKVAKSSRTYQNAMDTARSWHALMEAVIAQSSGSGPPQVQATGTPIDRSTSSVADEMRNLTAPQANKATLTPKQLEAALAGVFVLALVLSAWSKVVAVLLMVAVTLGAVSQARTPLTKIVGAATGGLLLLALIAVVWPGKQEKPRPEPPRQEPATVAKETAPAPSTPAQQAAVKAAPEPSPQQAGQPTNTGFWASEGVIAFADGGDCPDGLWALLPGEPPGKDEFEKRKNAGRRDELAKRMKQALFVLEREPHGLLIEMGGIDLGDYNFRQKLFPAKMEGTASCKLGPGESDVTIAFGPAKAVDESPASDGKVGGHEWKARPLEYALRVPEAEAPSFKKNHHGPLSAKLAFRIVGIKNHKLMARYGGNKKDIEDYGAGVLVEAKIAAVRIDDDEENLLDTSPKTEAR